MEEEKTTMGICLSVSLKDRLSAIAKAEHRSLSAQAEFFLLKSALQWDAKQTNNQTEEAKSK